MTTYENSQKKEKEKSICLLFRWKFREHAWVHVWNYGCAEVTRRVAREWHLMHESRAKTRVTSQSTSWLRNVVTWTAKMFEKRLNPFCYWLTLIGAFKISFRGIVDVHRRVPYFDPLKRGAYGRSLHVARIKLKASTFILKNIKRKIKRILNNKIK